MCFSFWCLLVNLMTLAVTLVLTNLFDFVKDDAKGGWRFQSCNAAVLIDCLSRLAVLNSAYLVRVVFIKHEKLKSRTWKENAGQLFNDYKKGLALCNPETFSDDDLEPQAKLESVANAKTFKPP